MFGHRTFCNDIKLNSLQNEKLIIILRRINMSSYSETTAASNTCFWVQKSTESWILAYQGNLLYELKREKCYSIKFTQYFDQHFPWL